MKKVLYILLTATAVLLSCTKEEQQTTKLALEVVLSQETIEMKVGETATLTARTLPATVGQDVTWSVLNNKVATVVNGVVTAVAPGVTYVVATSQDGAVISSCLVSVIKVPDYEFILMDANGNTVSDITAYPGYTTQVDVLTTDYREDHIYTWESSNPAAVSVTKKGQITLNAVPSLDPAYAYYGESVITIRAEDGNGCTFKVVSNVSSDFLYDQEHKTFGDEMDVKINTSHSLEFYYYNGVMNDVLPASVYTLTSSDSNVQVSEVSNKWQLKASATAGAQSQVEFKIGNANPANLLKMTTIQ